MKKVLFLLASGFEEIEAVVPADILKRGGVAVDLVSISGERIVEGGHEIRLQADKTLTSCNPAEYDMVFVPGGQGGVDNLKSDGRVLKLLNDYKSGGKWIAAICAGPLVLKAANVISGSTVTSYPSVREELEPSAGKYSEKRVIVDGKMATCRGVGAAEEFGLKLLELLTDAETAGSVGKKILAREC